MAAYPAKCLYIQSKTILIGSGLEKTVIKTTPWRQTIVILVDMILIMSG
jgi:hypothetical protein